MPGETEILGNDRHFPPTEWELLQAAPNLQSIDVLVRRYWKPLYFYVRRNRFDVETSKDIVQGFLANVISRDTFWKADPKLGRFRTFVLSASRFIRTGPDLDPLAGGGHRRSLDFSSVEAGFAAVASERTRRRTCSTGRGRAAYRQPRRGVGALPHQAFQMYLDASRTKRFRKRPGSQTAAKVWSTPRENSGRSLIRPDRRGQPGRFAGQLSDSWTCCPMRSPES